MKESCRRALVERRVQDLRAHTLVDVSAPIIIVCRGVAGDLDRVSVIADPTLSSGDVADILRQAADACPGASVFRRDAHDKGDGVLRTR